MSWWRRRVAVIYVTGGGTAVLVVKKATATIPIVFESGIDPVSLGLVASLNRPGGNITGATFLTPQLVAKRLEILHETVPEVRKIGFLVNSTAPQVEAEISEAEIAARALGVNLAIVRATAPSDFVTAFASLIEQQAGVILYAADSLFAAGFEAHQLADLALRDSIPTICYSREQVAAGVS